MNVYIIWSVCNMWPVVGSTETFAWSRISRYDRTYTGQFMFIHGCPYVVVRIWFFICGCPYMVVHMWLSVYGCSYVVWAVSCICFQANSYVVSGLINMWFHFKAYSNINFKPYVVNHIWAHIWFSSMTLCVHIGFHMCTHRVWRHVIWNTYMVAHI